MQKLKSDTLISLNQLNQANVQKLNQLPYLQFLVSDKAYFQDGQNYYLVEKIIRYGILNYEKSTS